ncbi:DUF6934 family protein [Parasediminibacterium sp. JCM 36343]|uniref:DUF6934 family protein n=1 Tax=Parasediminibacterium sp. JCM 36343 TaxID=3374279 RepID=UPI00397E8A95
MKLPKYQLKSGQELSSYEFISEGPKGLIKKQVQFTLINEERAYNLAFGDEDETGAINDLAISDNGDSEKVLATVIAAVYAFCSKHQDIWIYATGSTRARTRLYQMGIAKYWEDITEYFEVYGEFNEEWEYFEFGKNYTSFLAKQKIH